MRAALLNVKWILSCAVYFASLVKDVYLQDNKQSKRGVNICNKHEDV